MACDACVEKERRIQELELERDCERGVLHMTVSRLGGTVEGYPTARHNFLQRVDELVRLESELEGARRLLVCLKSRAQPLLTHVEKWLERNKR